MVILKADVGGDDSNSYVTVTEAEQYLSADKYFSEEWGAFSDDEKVNWLRLATRGIDTFDNFSSQRQTPWQSLEFPRDALPNVIPENIKRATMEMTMFLVNNKTSASGLEGREIASMRLLNGLVDLNYGSDKNSQVERAGGGTMESVRHLLAPWISPVRWARG